jgi:hypothetical protein
MGLLAALESRLGPQQSSLRERALTLMVLSWVAVANRVYLFCPFEGKRSLVDYFDEVVVTCLAAGGDLQQSLDRISWGARRPRIVTSDPA